MTSVTHGRKITIPKASVEQLMEFYLEGVRGIQVNEYVQSSTLPDTIDVFVGKKKEIHKEGMVLLKVNGRKA